MTTDARDERSLPEEGFHEIQLSGKQLIFLFMATTLVSVVIFLCGVLVGRGVRPDGLDALRTVGVGLESASDSVAPSALQDAAAESTTMPPPVPSEEPAAAAGQKAFDQLMAAQPPPETLAPVERRDPEPVPAPAPTAASTPAPTAAPAPAPAEQPRAVPAPAAPSPAASSAGFFVQVTALRQRQEAVGIASKLSAKGYKAFVLDPQAGASTSLYRVRVGPFTERAEAEVAAKRLTTEEQFNPFIFR